MGFCKPGDPCWGTLEQTDFGQVNLAKFLEYGSEAKTILAACGIDIDTLNPSICAQVNNCITGNTHHSLTACTIYADVIHPCTTGTTFTGNVRASARVGIGTSTTPNEKLTVVGAVSATSQLYFSEIVGGTF